MNPLARRLAAEDSGFTLAELLVAIVLFGGLAGMLATAMTATVKSTKASTQTSDLNAEARVALNRISRELREAQSVDAVSFDASGVATSLTFSVDFNGDGTIEPYAADPETVTYCYDAPNHRILLTPSATPSTCDNPSALPILTGDVEKFVVDFRSNLWQYDLGCGAVIEPSAATDCVAGDGVTSWQELDAQSPGNQNGVLDTELTDVDAASIDLVVLQGPRRQEYRTLVDLRNKA